MRRFVLSLIGIMFLVGGILAQPVLGQSGGNFPWPAPLNSGQMPANAPLLPPAQAMPVLPLPDPLIPGTVFFNAESFGEEYRIQNLTLDGRLYAYNITTETGVLPISPNGQYAITTVAANVPGPVTCGILDMMTGLRVDQFDTDGACSSVAWSPDSTRILFTVTDESGLQSLALRQNGQTTPFIPLPAPESDLGGGFMAGDVLFVLDKWISNTVFSFTMVLQGNLTEQLFVSTNDLTLSFPGISLLPEHSAQPLVLWWSAQPVTQVNRALWMSNLATGDSFPLAPAGHIALYGDINPSASAVAYWAAVEGPNGPTHPLRLVIFDSSTNTHTVLLQFDGGAEVLATRPDLIVWTNDGIYFYIAQQEGAVSPLQTGAYRIQPDGSQLEFVTEHLLRFSIK